MLCDRIRNVIDYLNTIELKVLEQRLDGYTFKGIGERLGIPLSTARNIIYRVNRMTLCNEVTTFESERSLLYRSNSIKRSMEDDADLRRDIIFRINYHLNNISEKDLPKYFGRDERNPLDSERLSFAPSNAIEEIQIETDGVANENKVEKMLIRINKSELNKAVYMDEMYPMTLKHLDIIKKSSELFDAVLVVVRKRRFDTLDRHKNRIALVAKECEAYKNVKVVGYDRNVETFAKINSIRTIIREFTPTVSCISEMTRLAMSHNYINVYIPCDLENMYITSELALELFEGGSDVSSMMTIGVEDSLRRNLI